MTSLGNSRPGFAELTLRELILRVSNILTNIQHLGTAFFV